MTTRQSWPITTPLFDQREVESVAKCLESGWVTQGPMVKQFETLFAARHNVSHALATTSCTAGLHLATAALGLGPEDEVIVPAFTWITSANCAEYVGARAVFADVEASTFNLDPDAFAAAITPKTRAVVVVHLFGLAARMEELLVIARRHHLAVIEDAACAVGTTYDGKPIGAIGDIGTFSFHPRKVITTGEGGMVTTNRVELATKVNSLRNHGASPPPPGDPTVGKPYGMGPFNTLGYNLRLSDIQAAVGVVQMKKLDTLLAERRRLAERYTKLLQGMEELVLPPLPGKCGHTYQSYVIRVVKGGRPKRNAIMESLAARNIQTRPGTHAVHRLGYYANKYRLRPEAFPVAAASEDTTITLPIFPGMNEQDQDFVVTSLKEACRSKPASS
jgi:dTDP-4-amino-4,6-dideoxygalactose transaminase